MDTPAHEGSSAIQTHLVQLAGDYLQALLEGERDRASQLILQAVDIGIPIKDIYLHVFQSCQHEIGRLWQTNQISVAQEHFCSAATQLIMSQLYPHILSAEKGRGSMVATCVGGELHEIGVRMVADFFEMEGWDTYYLGANTPARSVLRTIEERNADLLCVSATITFNIQAASDLIGQVRASEAGKGIRILVGGRPYNVAEELWRQTGADGFGRDAQAAVDLAAQLMGA
jgi:methanogenic corrinoid protein MtbC1